MSGSQSKYFFGWKPSPPDHRDWWHSVMPQTFQHSLDLCLTGFMPAVYDQGQLGSCTANGGGSAFEFDLRRQGLPPFNPARLFIYYNERKLEHSISYDSGATIRDLFKTMARNGVCDELIWPYDISKFTQAPSNACYQQAMQHRSLRYMRVQQSMTALKTVLQQGFPVVFGFAVHSNFFDQGVINSGIVPMPSGPFEGGHCVKLVGWNDTPGPTHGWKVKNSWGTSWGAQGYCYMPYAFLLDPNISSDFWTVEQVS